MPRKTPLDCGDCGKGPFATVSKLSNHRAYHCTGTTGRGHTSVPAQASVPIECPDRVSLQTSNDSIELSRDTRAGTLGTPLSTTGSLSERERGASVPTSVPGPHAPVVDDPDPMVEIKDAVTYLNARRDYLDRWELGFIGSVVFIVLSKTNGDRARHLTPDMVAKLFETRAKVEALEARDKAEAEYDRIQRHFTDMKQPGHVWCDLCEKERQSRIEGARVQEECRARDEAILEETRQRKEREEAERLEASRIVERRDPNALRRELVRKRLAARSAATTGAENGRPTDA